MAHQAKVFARVFDFTSVPAMDDGTMVFTVEWKLITGTRAAGKTRFTVDDISTDDQVRGDLRDQLASFLSAKFAPAVYRPRDIVGYSV